jgi:hypothetical protein
VVVVVDVVVVVVAGRVVVVVVVVGGIGCNCTGSIGDGAAGTVATRARPNIAEAAIASKEAITRSAGLRRTARKYGDGGGQRGERHLRVLSLFAGLLHLSHRCGRSATNSVTQEQSRKA